LNRQYEALRRPCPKCKGTVEREVAGEGSSPEVRCVKCGATWPSYRELIKGDRGRSSNPGMAGVQKRLETIRAGVRTGRNLAGGARALGTLIGRIADNIKGFEGHDSIARIGEDLEGIVDQAQLAVEHLHEAAQGKTPDLYDGNPEGEGADAVPPEGPEEEEG